MKIDTFDHKALIGPPKIPGLPDSMVQNANPSANADNAKKSNKKKKKSSNSSSTTTTAVKPYSDLDLDPPTSTIQNHSEVQADHVVDPAKKLRNLRKKLRDIETLEKKLADGSVANPEPEQLEKVARKPVMIEEIVALEAMVANLSTSA